MVEKQYAYKRSDKCKQCHMNRPMVFIFCRPDVRTCESNEKFIVKIEDD